MEKKKFLTLPDSNSSPSVVQPITRRHTDRAIPATQISLVAPESFRVLKQAIKAFFYVPEALSSIKIV
jgi:hypothetical protein